MYDNVTYIVAGIIIREFTDGIPEVLLIQEVKKNCYGKWYIPAGHVEPGETIEVIFYIYKMHQKLLNFVCYHFYVFIIIFIFL